MPLVGPVEYLRSLGTPLYPVQGFILKLLYGEELDSRDRTIEVRPTGSGFDQPVSLTEFEYLRFLQAQNRISIRGEPDPSGYRSSVLAMGRRSGKSHLIAFMHAYEAFALEESQGNYVSTTLAPSADMARNLARYFRDIVAQTQTITRETQNIVTLLSSTERCGTFQFVGSHRPPLNRLDSLVVDEAAYQGLTPEIFNRTLSPYLAPNRRLTFISTPNGHDPFFSFFYHTAASSTLALRIPTWEANPELNLDSIFMTPAFDRDFGASFDAPAVSVGSMWRPEEEVVEDSSPEVQGPLKSRFHIIEEINA
jgi:hypothetical protein